MKFEKKAVNRTWELSSHPVGKTSEQVTGQHTSKGLVVISMIIN